MIRINLRIDDSSTKLDDVKEPDIKLKASSLFTSGCQCLKKLTNLTLAHKLGAGHLSNNYQAFGNLHPAHPKKEKAVLLIILMKAPDGECSERVLELI